jgi:hypothetical protein
MRVLRAERSLDDFSWVRGPRGTTYAAAFAISATMLLTWGLQAFAACSLPLATVKQTMVQQSIAAYAGTCACPFNRDRAGHSCGGRSAYSRPGGAAPMCYVADISDAQATAYCERTSTK